MASNLEMAMGNINPQTQLGQQVSQAAGPNGLDFATIMDLVGQVEGLPDEVLQLVEHRRKQGEKEGMKAQKENNDQLNNLLEAARALGFGQPQQPQAPVPAPSPMADQGSMPGILNGVLGQLSPNLGV